MRFASASKILGAAAAVACMSVATSAQGVAPTPTQQVTVVVFLEEAMGEAFVTWAVLGELSADALLAGEKNELSQDIAAGTVQSGSSIGADALPAGTKFPLRRPAFRDAGHALNGPKIPGLPQPGILPETMKNPGQVGQPGSKIPLRKPVKYSGHISTRSL